MAAEFENKLIVVTGAAGGIGQECVSLFLEAGAELLLIDPNADALKQFQKSLNAGDRVKIHVSQIASPEACAKALDGRPGPIYGFVHLAGTFVADDLTPDNRTDVYDPVIASNLTNAYDMAIACIPRFDPDQLCRIVLTSSLAFRRGASDHTAYSAAKGGIAGLARSLSRRLAPHVLVNALAPGLIDTAMPKEFIAENHDRLLAGIPLGRFGHAREVATVIEFLCSDGASYMTGQMLNVDGGIVAG